MKGQYEVYQEKRNRVIGTTQGSRERNSEEKGAHQAICV